jgi:quercetin dioxygenase-like cupin family protein
MRIHSLGEVSEPPEAPMPGAERTSVVAFADVVVEVDRGGGVRFAPQAPGPPPRVDGHLLALACLEESPPHLGERHPDGDELIWLVSGQVDVAIGAPEGDQHHVLRPGEALIVPRGLWHRVPVDRPARLLHLTPGPSGEHRPLDPRAKVEEP